MKTRSSNRPETGSRPTMGFWTHVVLVTADKGLYALHLTTTAFIVFGWILPVTRTINFYLIVLTFLSWFVLGLKYGFNYCFFTGIQSKIRRRLGREEIDSFVLDVLERMTGRSLNPTSVEIGTQVVFYFSALASIYVNFGYRWV
jgi:hypothetical protein